MLYILTVFEDILWFVPVLTEAYILESYNIEESNIESQGHGKL